MLPSVEYVPWNEWTRVVPAPVGELTATVRVTVVVPARDCQAELDRTLAALSEQTYPAYLLDVVVVDDASHPPLRLPEIRPEGTGLLPLGDAGVHGSGRARAAGAALAEGDVLLFLDADMIADRHHVEAHLRWHHVLADAVVLGTKEFVDVGGIDPLQVRDAVRKGSLEELLSGRERGNHSWLDRLINTTAGLTRVGDDLFTAVVGASVSVPRQLYFQCGGFAAFDRRGIVDTEFGYRAVTAGAVVVPEPQARSVHQGVRAFAARGEEIKRLRAGLAANQLPHRIFRPPVRGRVWAVPAVRALVDATGSSYERLVVTVDALLASDLDDLAVTLHGEIEPETGQLIADYFGHDPRVLLAGGVRVDTGFPSQHTAFVPEGLVLGSGAIAALVDRMKAGGLGLVRAPVPAGELRLWRTAALHRARRAATDGGDLDAAAARLFGVAVLPSGSIKVTPAEPRVNRTGMVYDATLAPQVEPARARYRRVRGFVRRGLRFALRASHPRRGAGPQSPTG